VIRAGRSGGEKLKPEVVMEARAVLATVCAVGVPFYLRFLVALWKEAQHQKASNLVPIPLTANDISVLQPPPEKAEPRRAA